MLKRYFIYAGVAVVVYVFLLVLHKFFNYDIMSFIFFYTMVNTLDTNHRLYELENKGK